MIRKLTYKELAQRIRDFREGVLFLNPEEFGDSYAEEAQDEEGK